VKRAASIVWVESTDLEKESPADKYEAAWQILKDVNGILVAGGFGKRGIEGKIAAAQYARESKKPYLGICLGMQIAVIEYARNVLKIADAHSEEFEEKEQPEPQNRLVVFMPEISKTHMGGTMRLGRRKTIFRDIIMKEREDKKYESTIARLYGAPKVKSVYERHRHRYEVNPDFVPQMEEAGMMFVGQDETGQRQEIIELVHEIHPYFVGCQYHPEYLSRPTKPSPTFVGLLLAAAGQSVDEYIRNEM